MRTSGKQVAITSLIVVEALLASLYGQSAPSPSPTPAPPPTKLLLTSLKPDNVIEAGGDVRIGVAAGAVWVVNRSAGSLLRIDPKTNVTGKPVPLGGAASGPCQPVVSAFKSLWVALCGSKGLARFDEAAEKPPITVTVAARNVGPLTTATGSIWMVTDTAGTVARIDPDTNAVVAEITVPSGVSAMAFGMSALWIASAPGGTVTRVNAETNVVEDTIKVGQRPVSVAIGEGSVWIMNGGDSTVSRIDAKTSKVTETIKTGVTATDGTIAVGEGSVWLSASGMPLTRIDPASNRMVQQFSGPGGGPLAIGLKSLWLGATPTAIWRIDPRRVEATRK